MRKTPVAAVTALMLAAGLTGCGPSGQTTSSPVAAGCTVELDDEGSSDHVVILEDRTQSRVDDTTSATYVEGLLSRAAADGPLMSIGAFGGSDAEIEFVPCVEGGHFRPSFNSAARRERAIPAFVANAMTDFRSLRGSWSLSDPTVAYRASAEKLRNGTARRSVVIITDGLATAGCAALPSQVDPTDLGRIPALVSVCVEQRLLPNLAGVSVTLLGIGKTSPPLTSAAVAYLQELNRALCAATGATCTIALDVPTDL